MNKIVGERIRKFRVLKNFSQENMSEALGMSTGNYGKIERGEISISVSHLELISKVLEVSMSELIEDQHITAFSPVPTYGFVSYAEFNKLAQDVEKILKQLKKIG